jgi:hypothetical protein
MVVSPLAAGHAMLWVLHAPLRLHAHLASLPVSMGFDVWPRYSSDAWGEKSVCGGGGVLVAEASVVGPHQPALT